MNLATVARLRFESILLCNWSLVLYFTWYYLFIIPDFVSFCLTNMSLEVFENPL